MKPGINRIILSLALLMLFLLPAAGKKSEKKDSLKVTANLSGKIKNIKNKELVLTFSDDMLPFGGERDGKTILFITPKVKGEYLWRGAKTLVLKPEKQFAYSTRYKVTVKRGTASLNNKKLKKKFRLTFITPPQPPKPALQPKWIYFSNTRRPIYRMNRINDVPVDKPLRLVFAQPVSYKEVANEIVVMENTSNTPLKITCSQKTENAVVIHFLKPLKKASLYKVLLKKKLTGSTKLNRSRKDFYFYLKTREIFKVSSYPNYIQKEIKEIRVTFNFALKRIAKKNIRVYILRKGKPKVPCQFDVSTLSAKLDISISEPLTDGESLEIILDKAIGCVLGESLENDVHFTVKVCSVIPEIYPALKQEEPELYLSGVDNINYSFIKYKDSILDQLSNTQYRTREEIRALFEDKNNIEKEYTTRHRCENGESARLPLLPIEQKNDPQNKSRFQEGLFAYKVNHLEAQSKCDDTKLTNRVENVTNRLKLVYKRELDFVVRAGYKRTLVWVYNNKTAKGVPNTDVFLLRKTTEYPATQSSQSSKSTPSTQSTQSTKSTMSTTTATKKTDQEKKPAKKNRLNKRIQIGKTNNEGVCIGKVTVKKGDLIVAIDPKTNRKSFYRIGHGDNFYFDSEEEREKKKEYLLEVFTDRVLYRPGSTVHIGGVIKIFENGKITTPQLKHATLIVNSEDDETLKKEEVTLDEFGGFATTCPLGEECEKGEYTIYIDIGEEEEFGEAFLVDYYQPDAIKLEISEEKKVYGKNDIFNPLISGSYYSGNPMSGDALNYHISFDDYNPFTGKGDLEEYQLRYSRDLYRIPEKNQKRT
ncbi:MAG: hypothetical protein GY757_23150 [bacterium]|nr:hypothetical protein [bacterium]